KSHGSPSPISGNRGVLRSTVLPNRNDRLEGVLNRNRATRSRTGNSAPCFQRPVSIRAPPPGGLTSVSLTSNRVVPGCSARATELSLTPPGWVGNRHIVTRSLLLLPRRQ